MGKKKAAPTAAGGTQLISRFFSASATKKSEDAVQLPSRKRHRREGVDKAPVLDTAGKIGDSRLLCTRAVPLVVTTAMAVVLML